MKYRKASGEDDMPADLVKRSPLAFRKRCWRLINIILAGRYECQEEVLEAKVILLCKDHANPDLLSNFRPIAHKEIISHKSTIRPRGNNQKRCSQKIILPPESHRKKR